MKLALIAFVLLVVVDLFWCEAGKERDVSSDGIAFGIEFIKKNTGLTLKEIGYGTAFPSDEVEEYGGGRFQVTFGLKAKIECNVRYLYDRDTKTYTVDSYECDKIIDPYEAPK